MTEPEKEKKNALQEEKRDAEGPERAIVAKLQLAIRTTGVRVAKKKRRNYSKQREKKRSRTTDGQFNNPHEVYDEEYTSSPFPRVNPRK